MFQADLYLPEGPWPFTGILCSWAITLLVMLAPQYALADLTPLNGAAVAPNIAEITVRDDGVYVSLEIYIGDLEAFRELLPNDFLKSDTSARPSLDERLGIFSDQKLQVLADGKKLTAKLLVSEPRRRIDRTTALAAAQNALSQLPTPEPPKDDRVFYAELKYPFETRPDSLQLVPPTKPNGTPEVSIGFIAFHETVPVIDFRYLSGAETLTLDWDDPWYSRFDNKNLKRHHASALMTFLYVEPREVRHETLIRIRDLQNWTDLGITGKSTLDAGTQNLIKEAALAFFASVNPVEIDGVPVTATSSRAEFLTVSSSGLQIVDEEDALDLPNAILGVILSFPVPELPQGVTVGWELFSARQETIQATATDPAGPFLNLISADAPVITWSNYLKTYEDPKVSEVVVPINNIFQVPLISIALVIASAIAVGLGLRRSGTGRVVLLGLAGAGMVAGAFTTSAIVGVRNPLDHLPDADTSALILSRLLENVNTANLEIVPERREQELAMVVSSASMDEVSTELDRGLAIRVPGGGLASVDTVDDLVTEEIRLPEGREGFQALASWTVRASAGHWGHNHKRNVSYRALVEVVEEAGVWKLDGITVVDVKPVN